jgi:hypothetical protein
MKSTFKMDYLLHRITAKNRHGLHSPFVYSLLDQVIYDFKPYKVYTELIISHQKLRATGNKSNHPAKADELLYRLINHFKPQTVAEVNSLFNPLCITAAVPKAHIQYLNPGDLPATATPVDCVLMSTLTGDTAQYLDALVPGLHNQSVIIINDIYNNRHAMQQWKQVRRRTDINVTIDLYFFGLAFIRSGQRKEHFKLKY